MNELAGEACDDSGMSETCDIDCSLPECGDGVVNELVGESCDDGVRRPCVMSIALNRSVVMVCLTPMRGNLSGVVLPIASYHLMPQPFPWAVGSMMLSPYVK